MAPIITKRSPYRAVMVSIVCMLIVAIQIPGITASLYKLNDIKQFGIGEIVDGDVDEDENDEEDWDFMDDDAIFGVSNRQNSGETTSFERVIKDCVNSLPIERVDDNYCDCKDGSDEPNTSACSHVLQSSEKGNFGRQFHCKSDDRRVPLAFVDDGICDCCDGSDEGEGVCVDFCATDWLNRLTMLQNRLELVQRGRKIRQMYLVQAVDKVKQLEGEYERLTQAYQANQRAFYDLQSRVPQNPKLQGQLELSYQVLRKIQYVTYVQSRVIETSTFSDAVWKSAFVELVGQCFSYEVNEKELKGGTPNVIPRTYEMVLCPFQNVSQTESSYQQWAKDELETKGGVALVEETKEEDEVPRPIVLGVWNGWHDAASFARVQSYNHGEPCTNGQERQTRVELSCGSTNRVISVEERNMCEYEIYFETPAACEETEEEALLDEISKVIFFSKNKQPVRDEEQTSFHKEL